MVLLSRASLFVWTVYIFIDFIDFIDFINLFYLDVWLFIYFNYPHLVFKN